MPKLKDIHAITANDDAALCLVTAKLMLFLQTAPKIPIFFHEEPDRQPSDKRS